jgi:Uma2 family endonuclease
MSTKALLTSEDLWKIVADGSRYELCRGELVPMTPVGLRHSAIVMRLGRLLGAYVDKKRLGIVGTEGGFKLRRKPDTTRAPDLHFVSKARLAKEGITEKFANYPPDLAVEVLSPTDTASDVQQRVEEYLSARVPLVWVVDPKLQRVTVYRSLRDVKVLTPSQQLDGGQVIPGFRVKVSDIFAI